MRVVEVTECSDASLVAESLTGNREAFGQIVARYQTLICSLAYGGTGSLNQSEDLAQETFVIAWKQLANLREPEKLRSWLCGIARNLIYDALKKQGREPSHAAETLDALRESPATGPLPRDSAISKEEEAILWRAVEGIPEIYREPLVLFYREHQSVEAVAKNLELTEDAVKQRLSRARKLLHERILGFVEGALERTNPGKTFTLGAVAALPALAISAKAAATAATALNHSTATAAAKTIAMTTLQKTMIAAALAAAVGTGIYEARQASTLRAQLQTLRQQQAPLAEQVRQLIGERDDVARQLAALRDENGRLARNTAELLKLRGEAAQLRQAAQELAQLKASGGSAANNPTQTELKSWLNRVEQLKQRLAQAPEKGIPEFRQFLDEQDWLNAARGEFKTDDDYRQAMSSLRTGAENKFISRLQPTLKEYLKANNGMFPTDMGQLKPYFESPVDDAVLQHWEIIAAEQIPNLKMGGDWIITQRAPVDELYDSRYGIGPNGYGGTGWKSGTDVALDRALKTLAAPVQAFKGANNGNEPADLSQLEPYVTTPKQKAALQQVIEARDAKLKKPGD